MCSERLVTREIEGECGEILRKHFLTRNRLGYFMVDGICMPDHFLETGRKILDFEVRDDDVWVCSFPKTGTTWTQEMVWCLVNNLDYASSNDYLMKRFPFIDVPGIYYVPEEDSSKYDEYFLNTVEYLEKRKSPRLIKTHLPYELLPLQLQDPRCKAKMVVVTRNPKDTFVSYFHHCVNFEGYTGSFEDFAKLFLEDSVTYAPFDKNVLSYWEKRDDPRILFIKYEDMKKDLPSVIRKVSGFLGKSYNDDEVGGLAEHLSFENMRKSLKLVERDPQEDEGRPFLRKGQIGSWKESMSEQLLDRFHEWTEARFRGTGLDWEYS